ncbi:MAG: tetratricopeptide repeat protein, partial [Kiritimatiellae bacterium]|nr:tetratricopeptide repeat protein [Kiritimatiellia bacterium]
MKLPPTPRIHVRALLAAASLAAAAAGCSRVPPAVAVAEGQRALSEGRFEEAIPLLRAAARANKGETDAWYNLGMANLMAGHNRAAENAFSKAAALAASTDSSDALVALG